MNSQDIDEDSVDIEALQAQIDLSMSFAQNLVSSWVEPHKLAKSSRNKDLERELSDYMRRPPRLGVGAVVPEGHSQGLSRETARLKGKLAGSKRPREQEEIGPSQLTLHDEDESRAISIKKKARVDPFDVVHGKKKKKHEATATPNAQLPFPVPEIEQTKGESSEEVEDVSTMLNDPTQLDVSPVKTKKKPKMRTSGASEDKSNVTHKLEDPKPDVSATGDQSSVACITSGNKNPSPRDPPNVISPKPTKMPRSLPAELANVPLLNLNGPLSSDHESDGDPAASTPASSPKKKRRRRKKKKHLANRDPANV